MKTYKEHDWLYTFAQLSRGSIIAVFLVMGFGTQTSAAENVLDYFEIDDGNIESVVRDDWDRIRDGTSSAFATTHNEISGDGGGILHDELKMSIFTGGGSKDISDVSKWAWKHGSVPDKDEILHASAAAYNANGELLIYLMADRYAVEGSAEMGAWFFQERVLVNEDGTFSGNHKNGDLLMLATFTQGGAQANINLYVWDDTVKFNLRELTGVNPGYAISNGNETPSVTTDYIPKSGTPGMYPPNAFLEGGINMTQVFDHLGITAPCFSTFLIESRSSHRANAQLKDFVFGSFDTCKLEVKKSCLSSVVNTDDYTSLTHTYEYNVTNSGFGVISSVTFTDDAGTPDIGEDDFIPNDLGPLAIGETKSGQYTNTSSMNPPTNTIYATGHIGDDYAMAPVQDSATCIQVTQSPAISVTKVCKQTLESNGDNVVVRIDYDGVVCNDQNGTKLINVSVDDDVDTLNGHFDIGTLYPENDPAKRKQCETYKGTFYPTTTSKVCATHSTHSNTVTATGDGSLGETNATATASANCGLCDACNEPVPQP